MYITIWTRDKRMSAVIFRVFGRDWHIHFFRHRGATKKRLLRNERFDVWPLSKAYAKARYQIRKLRRQRK